MHVQLSSGASGIIRCLKLHSMPFFVHVSDEGYGESVQMRRLI